MQDHVLLALTPEAQRRLSAALAGLSLVRTTTAEELRETLATQQFDMVVVGAHFDESNALRMIEEIRRVAPDARVVCVRAEPFRYVGPPAMEAVRLACEALGVEMFVDLLDYPDDEAGNRAIRALFESRLSAARA